MISASRRWALTPVALLLACIGGQVVLVRATRGNPGLAIDEGYDERARRFDELEAGARKAEALGWRVELPGASGLDVRVTDGAGRPVAGATVRARALSLSGGAPEELRLAELAPGVYGGRLPAGRWELRLRVERDDVRLERTVLRDLAP